MAATQKKPKSELGAAAYRGLADELWAQHACLTRLVLACNDESIVNCIKAARTELAEAGKLADKRGAGK